MLVSSGITCVITTLFSYISYKERLIVTMKKKQKPKKMSKTDRQAAKKVKIASAPQAPNRLPMDQGTSI